MARPKMFVSSTYYDLKFVRADLQEFGKQFGLEAVLFERGEVSYEAEIHLEESCLREIQNCDLVVSIVGGRAGARAKTNPECTVSRLEVRHAHDLGKQIFCFVDKNVFSVYPTWEATSKKNERLALDVSWVYVDSLDVFKFIKELYDYQLNNAIFPFETSQDIIMLLREQLAGLFQTLLQRKSRGAYESQVDRLIKATETLSEIVRFLEREKVAGQGVIREIEFTRHPVFRELQTLLKIDARIFFESLDELTKLLPYFGLRQVSERELDDRVSSQFVLWSRKKEGENKREYIGLAKSLFDESGKLKPMSLSEWHEDYLSTSPQMATVSRKTG